MSYPVVRPSASRPLVVGAYYFAADGRPLGERPATCPCRASDDRPCRVVVNHHRKRKTGPKHRLLVVECRTHRLAFTVYPPGHIPYGRAPILRVGPDGRPIQREADVPESDRYRDTLLEACLDAATGRQWARAEVEDSGPWWNTQVRQLAVAERLLGLSPGQSDQQRERIATALEVPLLDLRCAANAIASAPGYRSRGAAALQVLERMAQQPCMLWRLLLGGHRAGLWGVPYWSESAGRRLGTPAFPVTPARAPPARS